MEIIANFMLNTCMLAYAISFLYGSSGLLLLIDVIIRYLTIQIAIFAKNFSHDTSVWLSKVVVIHCPGVSKLLLLVIQEFDPNCLVN